MKAEETDIFERYNALLSEIPDHVILSEGPEETDMTVKDLNLISAKVYRYLKEIKIHTE